MAYTALHANQTTSSVKPKPNIALIIGLVAAGISSVALLPIYGLTWTIAAIVAGVSIFTSLITHAGIKCFEAMNQLFKRFGAAADTISNTAKHIDQSLDEILEIKQAIMQTNQRINGLIDKISNIFVLLKGKVEGFDDIHQNLVQTLQQAKIAIKAIQKSVSKLTEDASLEFKESLVTVNEALVELQQEYVSLAKTAKGGVGNVENEIVDFKNRMQDTLKKLEVALEHIGNAAQGGSDLLSPIRGIGNIIRSLNSKFNPTTSSNESSNSSQQTKSLTENTQNRLKQLDWDTQSFSDEEDDEEYGSANEYDYFPALQNFYESPVEEGVDPNFTWRNSSLGIKRTNLDKSSKENSNRNVI